MTHGLEVPVASTRPKTPEFGSRTLSGCLEGSNSILIVGGSNVAWPAEVTDFERPGEQLQFDEITGG